MKVKRVYIVTADIVTLRRSLNPVGRKHCVTILMGRFEALNALAGARGSRVRTFCIRLIPYNSRYVKEEKIANRDLKNLPGPHQLLKYTNPTDSPSLETHCFVLV